MKDEDHSQHKLIEMLRTNLMRRIFPEGKKRTEYYKLFIKAYRILLRDGAQSFLIQFKHFIQYGPAKLERDHNEVYDLWIMKNEPKIDELNRMKFSSREFKYRPRISIITPVWNTDEKWLRAAIDSVVAQTYDNWELCIADGGSTDPNIKRVINEFTVKDKRIKVAYLNKNLGISGNSNEALQLATGEFIGLLDHDDELAPYALYEVVDLLNRDPNLNMIYSDEDIIDPEGKRYRPFFKPDWSPDLLISYMYVGHFTVYKSSLIKELGFRSSFDFSQDYDLALRATEMTQNIGHIQKILYHWRSISGSAAAGDKEFARDSNIRALASAVERRGIKGEAKIAKAPHWVNRIKYELINYPLVSIIIPTDNEEIVIRCIESIREKTTYPNFELIVVTNGNLANLLERKYEKFNVELVIFNDLFNFSLKCNLGARASNGKYLLFLNDDMEVIENTWIEEMVGLFQRPEVGAVGGMLVYENDTIQHAGLVTSVRGLIGTAFHCQPRDSHFYFHLFQSTREVSALSAACMMIPRDIFFEIGEFDYINTPIMHSDIDISFRIREKDYLLVYSPFAVLRHLGHQTLSKVEQNQKKDLADLYLIKRWPEWVSSDPYYTKAMRDLLYEDSEIPFNLIVNKEPRWKANQGSNERNILFVTQDLSLSGAPISLYNLVLHIQHHNIFVTIISPAEGLLQEEFKNQNIPVIIEGSLFENLHEISKKFISNFDIVICNTIISWPLIRICKELGLPVIWFIHESTFGVELANSNPDIIKSFGLADIVAFPSMYTANLYKKFHLKDNFEILYQGVEGFASKSHSIESGKISIVTVGSIEPRKGQDILIRNILSLPDNYIGRIDVLIIGRILNENYESKLRADVGDCKNFSFLGEVSSAMLEDIFKNADIYICTSRDEGFPLTLLEAMSCGKAIITFNVGGISEMIDDGINGIIVPFGDSKSLISAIMKLIDDQEYRLRLGQNAMKKYQDLYTIESYGERFKILINRLLK